MKQVEQLTIDIGSGSSFLNFDIMSWHFIGHVISDTSTLGLHNDFLPCPEPASSKSAIQSESLDPPKHQSTPISQTNVPMNSSTHGLLTFQKSLSQI